MENILKSISNLCKIEEYSEIKSSICFLITMIKETPFKMDSVKELAQNILNIYNKNNQNIQIDNVDYNDTNKKSNQQPKICDQKTKGNISSINSNVDTSNAKSNIKECVVKVIVENGENIAVIDSNKLFNPMKLTEHQKEKLRSKRDDIPALYQDLSQSQDEFKKKYWSGSDKIDTCSNDITIAEKNTLPALTHVNRDTNDINKFHNKQHTQQKNKTHALNANTSNSRLPFKDRIMYNIEHLKTISSENNLSDNHDLTTGKNNNAVFIEEKKWDHTNANSRPCRNKRRPKKFYIDDNFEDFTKKKRVSLKPITNNEDNSGLVNDHENSEINNRNTIELTNNMCIENIETDLFEKRIECNDLQENTPTNSCEIIESHDNNVEDNLTQTQCGTDNEIDTEQTQCIDVHTDDTPTTTSNNKTSRGSKSEIKTNSASKGPKQSRLVKELTIDMKQGNPYLEISSKRRTRKSNLEVKNLIKSRQKGHSQSKIEKDKVSKNSPPLIKNNDVSIIEASADCSNELPMSEDFIESSQDSTLSINSKRSLKKCKNSKLKDSSKIQDTLLMDNFENELECNNTRESSELTSNNLTATMDTEPMLNTSSFYNIFEPDVEGNSQKLIQPPLVDLEKSVDSENCVTNISTKDTDITVTLNEEDLNIHELSNTSLHCISSPFRDEDQRNKVFLNNTLDISPIKTSIVHNQECEVTPEKAEDYVVIKLSSPVQSNGEPIKESPEIFTNDKLSPSTCETSPPRETSSDTVTSPSLSLKKNRAQIRPSGRAAQMLSLCQSAKVNSLTKYEKDDEMDEPKKNNVTFPAKRNLQILYNINSDAITNEKADEDKVTNFLKLSRPLPAADSSPIGPILKRKLVDVDDECSVSPSNKVSSITNVDIYLYVYRAC